MGEIFAQTGFRLGILSELEFRHSLHIVTRPKPSEPGADVIEYAIGLGILLLLYELQPSQIICHEMAWRYLQDEIYIFVSRLYLSQRDVDIGTIQMSRNVLGVDLQRLVEEPHGASWSPRPASISPLT